MLSRRPRLNTEVSRYLDHVEMVLVGESGVDLAVQLPEGALDGV